MSSYPDIVDPTASLFIPSMIPFNYASSRAILRTEFANGIESRRLLSNSTRRNVRLTYPTMTFENANLLRKFYDDMYGPFNSFSFFFPQVQDFIKEYVGVITDTGTVVVSLPSMDAQTRTLYSDGVALIESTHWTFGAEAGADGEDTATLLYTPVIGDILQFTFTGRLKIKARFENEPIVFNDIKKYLSSTTVNLVGLEPQP